MTDSEWSSPLPDRPASPRRRRGVFVLALLLAIALLVTAAWGVATFRAGSAWREVAVTERARADAAERRAGELAAEVARLEERLDRSEADVADLEGRLASLAGEKAGAEDSAALASEVVDELAVLSRRGAEVGAALRDCVGLTVELTNAVLAAGPQGPDPVRTNRRIDEANARCSQAEDDYAALLEDLGAVGR